MVERQYIGTQVKSRPHVMRDVAAGEAWFTFIEYVACTSAICCAMRQHTGRVQNLAPTTFILCFDVET